jgi:homoserine kinase
MAGLVDAGAMAACWSGAGPSILGICLADGAPALRERAEALLGRSGVKGVALLVDPDRGGLQVTET